MSADLTVNTTGRYWWRSLTDVDPITLEPLKRLRYPPFPLAADASVSTWFDGHILATYLISTGTFSHPLSRRELTRDDCLALDAYLIQNRLGKSDVTMAFDHREDYVQAPLSRESRVAMLQAAATDLLTALFANASAGGRGGASGDLLSPPEGNGGGSMAARTAPKRAVAPPSTTDESAFPGLASTAPAASAQPPTQQQQRAGAGGPGESAAVGPDITRRTHEALGALRTALAARCAAREPQASAQQRQQALSQGETQVRKLCAKLQTGKIESAAFIERFCEVVGDAETGGSLLPHFASLLPVSRLRDALAVEYAQVFLTVQG